MLAKIARDIAIAAVVACVLAGGALYVRFYTESNGLAVQPSAQPSIDASIASVDDSGVYPVLHLRESHHMRARPSLPVQPVLNKVAIEHVRPAAVEVSLDPGELDEVATRMISQQDHPVVALGDVMDPETDTQFDNDAVPRFIGKPLSVDDYLAGRR